jgi:uncharacterized membrane protein YhaH (DUF805 family)
MGFADAVKSSLSQYVGFTGRARRSEYWWFTLFTLLVAFAAAIVDAVLGTYPVVYALAALALFLPGLAVGVRRLHNTGRFGWFYLIALIPLAGVIILLMFFVSDSKPDNEYGLSPKQAWTG